MPGYHLHFIDRERSRGGHLLECAGGNLTISCERVPSMIVAMPETEDFIKADFNRDPSADLEYAEKPQPKTEPRK